jgi:hypothetical protein
MARASPHSLGGLDEEGNCPLCTHKHHYTPKESALQAHFSNTGTDKSFAIAHLVRGPLAKRKSKHSANDYKKQFTNPHKDAKTKYLKGNQLHLLVQLAVLHQEVTCLGMQPYHPPAYNGAAVCRAQRCSHAACSRNL